MCLCLFGSIHFVCCKINFSKRKKINSKYWNRTAAHNININNQPTASASAIKDTHAYTHTTQEPFVGSNARQKMTETAVFYYHTATMQTGESCDLLPKHFDDSVSNGSTCHDGVINTNTISKRFSPNEKPWHVQITTVLKIVTSRVIQPIKLWNGVDPS
eukprot:m.55124 g.55124  ORF g.55124 m.55124 type:complete len:159 (-) comp11115_c0_seq2:1752-2228(-)